MQIMGDWIESLWAEIVKLNPELADLFTRAQQWIWPKDPLTLDLDGDGIETVAVSSTNPILFDHDGDGIKNATGWIKPDDGLLVLDRNGNGIIDNGTELFGDSTNLYSGGKAADGFAALAQEDTNNDGKISGADANFANLRVWRDLNQNGISEANELATLASLGIASIDVAKKKNSQPLPGGNEIADLGTYTKTDGSTGSVGQVEKLADVNLAVDTFHRQFPDSVALAAGVTALPNMQGSGLVRDLWEAMSQSAELKSLVAQFAAATTKAAQMAIMDQILGAWADTSGLKKTLDERLPTPHSRLDPIYDIEYIQFGSEFRYNHYDLAHPGLPVNLNEFHDSEDPRWDDFYQALVTEWENKLHTLEAFNGRYFFTFPWEQPVGQTAVTGILLRQRVAGGSGDYAAVSLGTGDWVPIEIRYSQQQLDLLNQSYDALKDSVYGALVTQTRLKTYLDQAQLIIDASGVRIDFAPVEAALRTKAAADAPNAVADLLDLQRYMGASLAQMGYTPYETLLGVLGTVSMTPQVAQALTDGGFVRMGASDVNYRATSTRGEMVIGNARNNSLTGAAGADVIDAGAGDDTVFSGAGDDTLRGKGGNDTLYGDAGNDLLDGGAGNDTLYGAGGADIYVFGKGSGQDTISNSDGDARGVNADTILINVSASDVTLKRAGSDLLISINGTEDTLRVQTYFYQDGTGTYAVENIRFADGTNLDVAAVKNRVFAATADNDTLTGYAAADTLSGGDGKDSLYGQAGDDTLNGDNGDDNVSGDVGNDLLNGGAGNDYLYGGDGNDTLDGGTGNDTLYGGNGADVYLFGKGSGQQSIGNADSDALGINPDTIQLGSGITASSVAMTRSGNDLLIGLDGSDDTLRVQGYFTQDGSTASAVETIRFADGTSWDIATVKSKVLLASAENDVLSGFATADAINAGDGNDSIYAYGGDDTLDGGSGADTLYGGDGADSISGGTGNDNLGGDAGNDTLNGGAGNDTVSGGDGSDTLDGNVGNDALFGGNGADMYLFGKGSGQDTINNSDNDTLGVNADTIQLGEGITVSDIRLTRTGNDLLLGLDGSGDGLRVQGYFTQDGSTASAVETIKFADGTSWDIATVKGKVLLASVENDVLSGFATADAINAGDGNDSIYAYGGDDALDGGTGADTLYGGDGADLISGGTGNDNLSGDAGNDTLDGGTGNDTLSGGTGADTYLFGKGSGQDTINNSDNDTLGVNPDIIQLGEGITVSDIRLTRTGNDLLLGLDGSGDGLRVQGYFTQDGSTAGAVETIRFADGTSWDIATVKGKVLLASVENDVLSGFATADAISAGDGNDSIYAYGGDDALDGGTGADTLYGGDGADSIRGGTGNDNLSGDAGNDTLDGGTGNDTLSGGTGADTYLFGKGSGQDLIYNYDGDALGVNVDTVQLGAGLTAANVTLTRSGNDLVIGVVGTDDRLTASGYFYSDATTAHTVENIKLADGTNWEIATVKNKVLVGTTNSDTLTGFATADVINGGDGADTLSGGDGDDVLDGGTGADTVYGGIGNDTVKGGSGADNLSGDAGNDTLDGGTGNDTLSGGTGADTYLFGKGSGQDLIYNYDADALGVNADTIQLGAGLTASNVTLARSGNDLAIGIAGTDDRLTVSAYFYSDATAAHTVENVKFADGTTWDVATVKSRSSPVATPAGVNISGTAGNDVLTGGSGDDTLNAYAGNDTLNGGANNDTLDGGVGNDIYLFGRGSGKDRIYSYDTTAGKLDVVQLGAGVLTSDIVLKRDGDALVLGIKDSADSLRIESYFNLDATGGYQVEQIKFADGTIWDVATVKTKASVGSVDNDTLTGTALADTLAGLDGDDTLYGRAGIDTLDGGAGEDRLYGEDGDDILNGGAQNDSLSGGNGNDTLQGQDGADALTGEAGNDTLDGGAGSDTLDGGLGNDIYLFGRGSGKDRIYSRDTTAGKLDVVQLSAGVLTSDIALKRDGDALVVGIKDSADSLRIESYFYLDATGGYQVEQIKFADGTIWDVATVKANASVGSVDNDTLTGTALAETLAGLDGDDTLYGRAGNDALDGGGGEDRLYGEDGDDNLNGGAQNDSLSGGNGNDTLDGGAGSDTLDGGLGNDTYLFGRGAGKDSISSRDTTVGKLDVVQLSAGVLTSDIALKRDGDALVLGIKDSADSLRIESYFNLDATGGYQVEQIKFADGTIWDVATVKVKASVGSVDNDTLTGTALAETLAGLDGDDTLYGRAGNDALDGGGGDDRLYGEDGDDILSGGAQSDSLSGGNGNDSLQGQDGNDSLTGDAGNDTLDGGAGDDAVTGGTGNNTYLFGKGDGKDTIGSTNDATAGKLNVLQFKAGVAASEVAVSRSGASLVLAIAGSSDKVTVQDFFYQDDPTNTWTPVQQVRFADGIIWDIATLKTKASAASADNDTLIGTALAETLAGLDGDDTLYGRAGNDTLDGDAGEDTLYGEDGDDLLKGGTQIDTLNGGNGADTLQGQDGNDSLNGNAGNDTLDGGAGNDTLDGGVGNDIYLFGRGSGKDRIYSYDMTVGKLDVVQFGADILTGDIALKRDGDALVLCIKDSADSLRIESYFSSDATGGYQVEQIKFADGTIWDVATVKAKASIGSADNDTLTGTALADMLAGLDGDDTLYGRAGNDTLDGGAGDDRLYGEDGDDILDGGAQNDSLSGGNGNDSLDGEGGNDSIDGGAGNDLLHGGNGIDSLSDSSGSASFNGGAGADSLSGGVSAELYIGGQGSDTINTGNGADIVVFNKGDGVDSVSGGTGTDNTLSLGGGIRYAELQFRKVNGDLILDIGEADSIAFRNWYAAGSNYKSVAKLQVILDASPDYNAASSDAMLNKKVEQFDFAGLATKFDQALAATPSLSSWALSSALASYHLGGSDTAALGGDLAYYYGKTGNVTGMTTGAAQDVIGNGSFGTANQTLRPFAGISGGSNTLS